MIHAGNLIEAFAKLRFYKWHSTNTGKWVVFEALPEEPETNTKRTSSFETEDEANIYLEARKQRFIEDLKRRIDCRPILESGQESLTSGSQSTTKSSSKRARKQPGKSSKPESPPSTENNETPPFESGTSAPF